MPLQKINFMEWYSQATEDEKRLFDKVEDFGPLFEDMLFREGTTTYKLIQCQSQDLESGEWEDDTMSLPYEVESFSYARFRYKIEPLEDGCDGVTDFLHQIITITPEASQDDSVILHELIHVHECVINELPLFYHDMILWALYADLKNKIPNLDGIITDQSHLLREDSLYKQGGEHDILFLLKSFDLDLRMGYPLGKVFGYGRQEELENREITSLLE